MRSGTGYGGPERDAVNVEPRGIKLRFHLRDADLYGFRFEPE